MDVSGSWPYFKVFHSKLNDMRFAGLSNTDWGIFHKLENYVSLQPDRGFIQLPPQLFCQVLAKNLNIRTDHLEKYLTKFKERELLDYSIEGGWLDFIYFKQQQKPLSDADRKRRQRERDRSRQRDENVTKGVTQKRREEKKIQDNSSVTAPPPGEDGGAGQDLTPEEMVDWFENIKTSSGSIGVERDFLGHFQTKMQKRSEADRQKIIRLARKRGLTIPE